MDDNCLLSLILRNLADESNARSTQWPLINHPDLDEADKAIVREISADETNHALKYEALYKKYANIVATSDGALTALHYLKQGIEEEETGGDIYQ